MFCQECGAENQDDSVFCQNCGARLAAPDMVKTPEVQKIQQKYVLPQQVYYQPKAVHTAPGRPVSKKTKIIIGVIVLLCIVTAGLYNFAKMQFSPKKAAEQYFLDVMNAKWGDVYQDFDIKETKFITKDNFIKVQKGIKAVDYNTFKAGKAKYDDNALGAGVVISYRLKGDSDNTEFKVDLSKQKGKKLLFFNTWKVNPSSYLDNDFQIQVPKEAAVTFNGVKLNSKYRSSESDEYYTCYSLPKLFKGKYRIDVTEENMNKIDRNVSTSDGNFYVDQMTLKKTAVSDITKAGQDALQAIYKAGMAGQDFSTIADYFTEDQAARDQAESNYNDFKDEVKSDGGEGITKIDLHDFTGSVAYGMEEGDLNVSLDLSYNYDVTFNSTDWWTGDISSDTYSDSDSNSFTYVYENNKWVIKSADFNIVYYY